MLQLAKDSDRNQRLPKVVAATVWAASSEPTCWGESDHRLQTRPANLQKIVPLVSSLVSDFSAFSPSVLGKIAVFVFRDRRMQRLVPLARLLVRPSPTMPPYYPQNDCFLISKY